jgi:hypothetical protein
VQYSKSRQRHTDFHAFKVLAEAKQLRGPDTLADPDRPAVPQHQQPEEGVVINPDTSVNVYFGPKPPQDKESNCSQGRSLAVNDIE